MADVNISELATVALRNRSKQLADNFLNHNALFMRLNERGNVKPADGGRDIVQELEYSANGTVSWYSGYEVLDITPQTVFDAATYDWKQLAGTVTISGLERIKNSGKERIFNLIESRLDNLEKSMVNTAATAVHSDGTGTAGKEIGGLQLLVADDPTTSSTVGGINQSTYSWWQNQYSASAATSSGNITSRMNTMWLTLVRGTDKPDLIVMDSTEYDFYESSLQSLNRFSTSKMADAGFTALKYKDADVVYDDQCTAKRIYMLNTDYLFLRPHSETQFMVDKDRVSINQDATVIPILWAGNMTCNNRSLQGVIIDD